VGGKDGTAHGACWRIGKHRSTGRALPQSRRRTAALVSSLLLAVTLSASAVACDDQDQVSRTPLTVVDQNILHGVLDEDPAAEPWDRFPERIRLLADALAGERPDVIFLQEVVANGEPDYGDPRTILLQALGDDYTAVFGDITGGAVDTGAIGQMTLTHLPVLSSENRSVSPGRSVLRVTVETPDGPLDLYNAHLSGSGPGDDASLTEIENVISFINDTRSDRPFATAPALLAGDFNAVPDDPSIQRLLRERFVDVMAEGGDPACDAAGDPGCTNSAIPLAGSLGVEQNNADRRIDYIFTLIGGRIMKVKEARPFLREPLDIGDGPTLRVSDHIGIWADIEVLLVEG
jgi:endonuclease/exonuclease/phosphatase family metal-dependent hydrolase